MAPVKVFGPAMSTNVARVLVFLEEVGAEYEVVDIDFKAMEHKSPEHLARNVSNLHGFKLIPRFVSFLDLDDHSC
jgi:predicted component of type VI protein secretion system